MTTQLSLYNDALLICGERAIASLTENREPRRLLDQAWSSGALQHCLESGQWYFAMRALQVDYDQSIQPSFGYTYAFQKPTDWVLTSALCSDEFFRQPLIRSVDEAGYWYSDIQTIYARVVSNSVDFGLDLNKWPDAFRDYVAHYIASKIILKISGSDQRTKGVMELLKESLKHAKSNCAMAEETSYPAQGNWSKSRLRGNFRNDGGNVGQLIG